ncbi:FhaA domain-containing protein [Rhodococcus kronopolitis]|uniref:FhaA domain-containing protein n=1 Tax=Rhodococcus kronopolitis TaxID=1460226 RepID=A0ABV9FW12_9NOCA
MGIVQRFERRLQGAVGDAFARVFGGGVVPQEVEAALQREASDRVQQLDGGHLLAPNDYVITVAESDHDELSADRDLTVKAFARHLEGFIREQGWQTYGSITVRLESSPSLHTGQFRTSGAVDPDAGSPLPGRDSARKSAPPAQPRPSAPLNPGAGYMSQNSGYGPNDHADGRSGYQDQPVNGYARNGSSYPSAPAQGGHDQPYGAGQQNGYAPNGYGQNGAADYPAAQAQGAASPSAQAQGYDYPANPYPPASDYQNPYAGSDYQAAPDYPANPYPPASDYQNPYAGSDYQAAPDYPANPYPPADYPPNPYAGSDYPAYGQQYDAQPPAFDAGRTFTATLQLEDGSGRNFQLREGRNVIGRGQEAQFRLPDTGVSRRHIEIRWDGQMAMLSDLGSTNGTTVNGAPVQDWQLADGDVIRAGHSEILVRIA